MNIENNALTSLIVNNDDCKRGKHFPLTDIYNEGWMLRLTLNKLGSNDELKKILRCEVNKQWFSEAELPSPFLQGKLNEKRTHADAVIGSFAFEGEGEEKETKTGVKIDSNNFKYFYAIEAKMYSSLSKGITHCKEYNQATRYIGCLAYMAFKSKITKAEFNKLGLFIFCPKNTNSIKYNNESIKKEIEKELNDRIIEYRSNNPSINNDFFSWWEGQKDSFLRTIVVEIHHWEEIINENKDKELFDFYEKCKLYNCNYKSKRNKR